MSRKSSNPRLSQTVKPITLLNIFDWANHTARCDKNYYYSMQRNITLSRLFSILIPNLRCPIFIIGAPRSGTTFLGSCIAHLPEFSYHFEPVATKAAARYVYDKKWGDVKSRCFYRNVYRWLMRIHGDGDLRFAEKTPRNSLIVSFLSSTFPDAQFIHIIRDGRDAALSLRKKPWLQASQANSNQFEPGGYPFGPYAQFWVESDRVQEFETTNDIHRCIWAWGRFTESALEASKSLSADRYHELRYESLVKNPMEESKRLLDFLRITDPRSHDLFFSAMSSVKSTSVGQWRHELSKAQLQEIDNEAGYLLRQLNYM